VTIDPSPKHLPPGGEHASEQEYRAFLRGINSDSIGRTYLRTYRWFVSTYPDLDLWPKAPLQKRVQELADGVPGPGTGRPLALKPYLLFLVNTGRARIDWPWILSTGKHPCRNIKLPDDIEQLIERLRSTSAGLGLASKSEVPRRWIKYLYLAGWRPEHGVEAGIAEAVFAAKAFNERPDLADICGADSPDRWKYIRREHFCLQTLAYHSGLISAQPKRRNAPSPFKRVPPERMAETIEKYIRTRLAQGMVPKSTWRGSHS